MKKCIYTLVFVTLFHCFQVNAKRNTPSHKISGQVVHAKTGENISYINITIKNTTLGVQTNATGHYEFTNVPEGDLTFVAQGIGYETQEKQIKVEGDKELNFYVSQDIMNLSEVVVTGGRVIQKRVESPVIVNTIDEKLLESTQSNVLGEGLNYTPGLRYENDCQNCGYSQVRMNGMEGPYSQILINSRPIFSGLAGVYGLELIPSNMLERIEVVKGGGSVLYGSNSIAGTINLILKDPTSNNFEIGNTTSLIGGYAPDNNLNFNTSLVTEDYNTGLAVYGNVRDRAIYDANDDDFSEIAPMKNTVVGARFFHRPSYRGKVTIDFFNIREERNGGNKQDYTLHERDVAEAVKHDMKTGALTYTQYFRMSDQLSVFASGQYLDRDSYYGANQSLSNYGNSKDKTYNIGTQYKLLTGEKSSLVVGVEYTASKLTDIKLGYPDYENAEIGLNYSNTLDSIYSIPHVDNVVVSNQRIGTGGVFAQYEVKVNKVKFMLGTRLDNYSIKDLQNNTEKTGSVIVPRLGVMYDVTKELQFRLGFSRGYRAPQIFDEDLHIETSGSRQVIHVNDPKLTQENSSSFTASADFNKVIAGINTSFLVEAFNTILHNPFRNEIGMPDEDGTVIYTRVNSKDEATVRGLNIEAKLYPSPKININTGFTFQTSKYRDGDEIFNEKKFFRTPNAYGFFSVDWMLGNKFGVGTNGTYTGSMLVPYFGPEILDPEKGELRKSNQFFDVGIKLHYNIKISKEVNMELFAGLKNIFNSYQNDFDKGVDRDPAYIYGPSLPRTIFFGIKIDNIL